MSALRSLVLDEFGRPVRSVLIPQEPSRARMTGYQVGDGVRGTLVRANGPDQRPCQTCGTTIRQTRNGNYGHADGRRDHKADPGERATA